MMPFLVGDVLITKPDGTVVHVGGTPSDSTSPASTELSTPSRHHSSNSGNDAGTVVPIVAIVFVFLWLIIKALMAPFTQRAARRGQGAMGGPSAGLTDEEQAVLLKLQRTLTDMERRIESLETILIDEHRTKENYGSKI